MGETSLHLARYRIMVIALFVAAVAALAMAMAAPHGGAGTPQATNGVVHTNN